MLTKQDLNAIGNLIDERLDVKLEGKLESKLESKLEEKLSPIRKDIRKVQKTLDFAIDHFDKNNIKIVENVRDIQARLDYPVMDYV